VEGSHLEGRPSHSMWPSEEALRPEGVAHEGLGDQTSGTTSTSLIRRRRRRLRSSSRSPSRPGMPSLGRTSMRAPEGFSLRRNPWRMARAHPA